MVFLFILFLKRSWFLLPTSRSSGIFRIDLQSRCTSEVSILDLLWLSMLLVILFQSYQCIVFRIGYYQFSLFMLSLIWVFLIFDILIYSWGNGKFVARLRILLQTLHPTQLYIMHRFYIMDFSTMDFYGFHQLYFTIGKKYYWLSH